MDASAIVSGIAILSFAALLFSASVNDILSFTVPNRLCLAIGLLYPAYVLSAPEPVAWLMSLSIATGLLALGFLLFSLRICGGGDAKLFAAAALWAGPDMVLPYAILTTLAGGVIVAFLWLQHRISRAPVPSMIFQVGTDPDFGNQPMPYGAAIGVGGLYVAFTLLRLN